MSVSSILMVLGIVLGLYYASLGISVGGYFLEEERRKSPGERLLHSGALWSLSTSEYSDEGKKLCARGNLVLALLVTCWVAWAFVK
jgi:hypothetical protein